MLLRKVENALVIKTFLEEFLNIDDLKTENIDGLNAIINKKIRVEFNNANPQFTLLGYKNEDLIAKNFLNYDHPDGLEIFNKIKAQ